MARKFIFIPSLLPVANSFDVIANPKPYDPSKEKGSDRLKRVLQTDEFGKLSPEVETVLQVGCMSMFVGALYGGVIQSRMAYMNFFRENQATIYKDHLEAKKRLQDKVTLAFGRGAFKWGWRLTLFCTSYVGLSSAIAVYRGKNGLVEHLIAGTVTGATYKFSLGPRGWIVGGGLGFVLGLIAGGTTLGLLKLTGLSMEQVRYNNTYWLHKRQDTLDKGIKEHLEKEEMTLLLEHDRKVDGKTLDVVEKS